MYLKQRSYETYIYIELKRIMCYVLGMLVRNDKENEEG